LLDIQHALLDGLKTRVVIPVERVDVSGKTPLTRLTPVITIAGEPFMLMTPLMAGIAKDELGESVDDARAYRDEILGAVDFLVFGI
jgi:toxin CcdB